MKNILPQSTQRHAKENQKQLNINTLILKKALLIHGKFIHFSPLRTFAYFAVQKKDI